MERDPIALAVLDDRPKPVRSDRVLRLEHFSFPSHRGLHGRVQTTWGAEVNERTRMRGDLSFADTETARSSRPRAGKQAKLNPGTGRLLRNFGAEHRGIKLHRPVQIADRNIRPTESVAHGVTMAGRLA